MSDSIDFGSILSDLKKPARRARGTILRVTPMRLSNALGKYVPDEDEVSHETTVAEFCRDNSSDPGLCKKVRRLCPGLKLRAGGGASPVVDIERVSKVKRRVRSTKSSKSKKRAIRNRKSKRAARRAKPIKRVRSKKRTKGRK